MLIFADSFDHYGVTEANLLNGVYTFKSGNLVITTTARTGNYALFTGAIGGIFLNDALRYALPQSRTVLGVALGLYFPTLPNSTEDNGITLSDSANNPIASISVEPDGSITFKSGSAEGTTLAVTEPVITAEAWNHVEFKIIVDPIVGSIEMRVNGDINPVLVANNLDLGSEPISLLSFVYHAVGYAFDDLIIWDDTGTENNDFFGPARVLTVFSDADTAVADFTVTGAATGHEAIDEIEPDGDASYINGSVVGNKSEFELPELPPEVTNIAGVYVPTRAKLAAPGVGSMKVTSISGASEEAGPDIPLTSAYTYWPTIFEKDPDTGLKWSKAGFEAAKIRVEKSV